MEETLLLVLLRQRKRKRKNRTLWVDHILLQRAEHSQFVILYPELRKNEKKFFKYFRMSIASFDVLISILKESVTYQDTIMRKSISAEERIAITLRYMATGCAFDELQYAFRCGISTISEIIQDVCDKIWSRMKNDAMPELTQRRWTNIAEGFLSRTQFPNCIGAVDGKHVRIYQPQNSGSSHYNYKKYFSIILLAICDADYKFIFVDVGAYGRHSDSTIYEETLLYQKLQNKTLNVPENSPIESNGCALPYVFVGDGAFSLSENLLRPYSENNLTEQQRIFNYRLSRARRYVECTFGILSNKWRVFHRPIDLSLEFSKKVVRACCVLHNFVRDRDGYRFEDTLEIVGLQDTLIQVASEEETLSASSIREKFAEYFVTPEGRVSWQLNSI